MQQQKRSNLRSPHAGHSRIAIHRCNVRATLRQDDDATHAHVAQSHQLGSVIAESPPRSAKPSQVCSERADGRAEDKARRFALGNVAASELAQPACWISSDYLPRQPVWMRHSRVADDDNRFTLPQAAGD